MTDAENAALDALERDLDWTATHVGAPGSQARAKPQQQLEALRALRRELQELEHDLQEDRRTL